VEENVPELFTDPACPYRVTNNRSPGTESDQGLVGNETSANYYTSVFSVTSMLLCLITENLFPLKRYGEVR
jgi:hypothetical protein